MPLNPETLAPQRWDLASSSGMDVLRGVLADRVRGGGEIDQLGLRRAAQLLCAEARGAELRAEQLVVALKMAWSALPELRLHQHSRAGAELLERAVTLCIAEFYAAPGASAPSAPPAPPAPPDSVAS